LAQFGSLKYLEPAYQWSLASATNDSYYDLHPDATFILDELRASTAWERVQKIQSGMPITVGVVDSGIYARHPDLAGVLWTGNAAHGQNFARLSPGSPSTSPPVPSATQDDDGHGTEVAGLIAAQSNNGEGIASIAWGASKVSLVVSKYTEHASGCTDDLIDAIDFAANAAGAQVVNLSSSQCACSDALREELQALNKVLFVAAVANRTGDLDSTTQPTTDYPTSYHLPNVLSVGAAGVLRVDLLVSKSLQKHTLYGKQSVDIDAIGVGLTTTLAPPSPLPVGPACPPPTGGRDLCYGDPGIGTSFAAPQVTAAAALIKSFAPSWTNDQIRQYLVDSATKEQCPPLPGTEDLSLCDKARSNGILNVDAAIGPPASIVTALQTTAIARGAPVTVTLQRVFLTATNLCASVDFYLSSGGDEPWTDLQASVNIPSTIGTPVSLSLTVPADFPTTAPAVLSARCSGTRLERWVKFPIQ
jgi:subtilisin family serine protease